MKKLAFVFSFLLIAFGSVAVWAEDKTEEAPKKNEVLEAADAFMKDLDERSRRHFSIMYGNYNLIKVVESVRENVEMAVDACGEVNSDMKEPLETRFDEWKAAIKPIMEEADANVGNMILAQEYAEPREIKKFFKLVDKARKDKDKEIEKVPVTSPEACQTLLENMDKTQPEMTRLLKTTLVSLPMVMQQQDQVQKEEEARVAAEKEAAEKEEAEKAEAGEAEKPEGGGE
ncbi:MAG: hypothetical protein H6860_02275 [Rhodospirillales bacterium]|nr:hypothetical protein [Alphaproteobacteria bacterium]MCB9981207.1 hypothetical protein [Rhodospirillales bacterium]